MTDAFALLGLPRRAALDAEELKAAYVLQSRDAHPDNAGGDAARSMELNAAYELLKEPENRLKHLLELEGGEAGAAWGTIPMTDSLMTVFTRLSALLPRVDAWVKKRDASSSALAHALLASEQMTIQEEVEAVLAEVEDRRAELLASLPEVDGQRAQDAPAAIQLMRTLRAQFAYLGKWRAQAREALLKLA